MMDILAANLSEGFGRFFYKENKRFGYYSRGSLYETRTWLKKALSWDLMDKKTYSDLTSEISVITKMLMHTFSLLAHQKVPDSFSFLSIDY